MKKSYKQFSTEKIFTKRLLNTNLLNGSPIPILTHTMLQPEDFVPEESSEMMDGCIKTWILPTLTDHMIISMIGAIDKERKYQECLINKKKPN